MIKILLQLNKKVKSAFFWIWHQKGTPAQRARGVAVGIFSGCFPFFGFQSLIGICLASVFKGNHLLAVASTWVSNPFTYLPLYWFNYKVGVIFLGRDNQLLNIRELTHHQIWYQGWMVSTRIIVGSSIVGLLSGLIVGYSSYILFKLLDKRKIF